MSGYRLTKFDRSCIIKNAVNDKFDSHLSVINEKFKALNDEIYVSLFGQTLIDKVNQIPVEWLNVSNRMYIRLYNGYQLDVDFVDRRPTPRSSSYYFGGSCTLLEDKDLGDRLIALTDELKEIKDQKSSAESKLRGLLDSVSTLKQLKEIWPDGKMYYSHLTPTSKSYVNNVPALLVQDINKIFSLPKEVEEAA